MPNEIVPLLAVVLAVLDVPDSPRVIMNPDIAWLYMIDSGMAIQGRLLEVLLVL